MYSNAILTTLRQIQDDLEFIEFHNKLIAYSTSLNLNVAYAIHTKSAQDSTHLLFTSLNSPLSKYSDFLTYNLSEDFTKFYISDFCPHQKLGLSC